jgi:hypothetical protein
LLLVLLLILWFGARIAPWLVAAAAPLAPTDMSAATEMTDKMATTDRRIAGMTPPSGSSALGGEGRTKGNSPDGRTEDLATDDRWIGFGR